MTAIGTNLTVKGVVFYFSAFSFKNKSFIVAPSYHLESCAMHLPSTLTELSDLSYQDFLSSLW